MFIYLPSLAYDTLSCLLLFSFLSIDISKATSSTSFINDDHYGTQVEEYIMTSAIIDGIKRLNVCGEGYRIEGALLRSYPYSKRETYLPYENCYMTFQARRADHQIRIRIITLDLNDIYGGSNCLDSLRFYKSPFIIRKDKIDSVECGQLNETDNFSIVSPTGIVTAHFSTDGGNVNGLGFKVILTAFRHPNKTHPCDSNDEEFLCQNGECISSLLLCDGLAHCLDGSDEIPHHSCTSNIDESSPNHSQANHRAIFIIIFLLLLLIAFTFFMVYFVCRRCIHPSSPLASSNEERKNDTTIINSPLNGPKSQVIITNEANRHRLNNDYNFL